MTTAATVRAWNIVRRAYSKYEVVAMIIGTWSDAVNFAMYARVTNGYDGEYFERAMGERIEGYIVDPMAYYYSE